jgi:hypothetical protein
LLYICFLSINLELNAMDFIRYIQAIKRSSDQAIKRSSDQAIKQVQVFTLNLFAHFYFRHYLRGNAGYQHVRLAYTP